MEIPFCLWAGKLRGLSWIVLSRLEFDAYRSDLEELSLGPRDAAAMVRIEMSQHDYQVHRDKYERLRSDVTIKLKFLEENKVCKKKKKNPKKNPCIPSVFTSNYSHIK